MKDTPPRREGSIARLTRVLMLAGGIAAILPVPAAERPRAPATVEGEIVDAETGRPLPARLYIQAEDGGWHYPTSVSPAGSALRYERQRANSDSFERHTTLSAHPFRVDLPPGRYVFTVACGPEYRRTRREVTVAAGLPRVSLPLQRWANLAQEGWYSGDTHVHRAPDELANLLLAEDLNVAVPLLDWATDGHVPPTRGERSQGGGLASKPVSVDPTHLWYPRNTEYEITQVNGRGHRLGAFFVLNHNTRFERPVFPLADVIAQARREGALIDLEKHNWPWTIALAPILKPDVIELANNHHWEVAYAVKQWAVPAPAWMKLPGTGTDTERDWTMYGLQTYYALLNCGFRIAPTAGTANGVHPVPLGFSRVYVRLDEPFSFDAWIHGLRAGRSFITNGPMLLAQAEGRWPGATLAATDAATEFALRCDIRSEHPLEAIELIMNGEVVQRFEPANRAASEPFRDEVATRLRPDGNAWFAWRCFERRPAGRFRFAHSAPWYVTAPGRPLRPRRVEADWLVARVKEEIARSRGVVPDGFIAEYERALRIYEELARQARD